MKGTQLILKALLNEGVDHVFMVPGGLIDSFYPDLCEKNGLKAIVAAHEAGAAFMADGYARASGLFGACFVIGGPGATNTATAMAAALTDRSPILLISGEVPTLWDGLGGFQDASFAGLDALSVLKPVTLFSEEVENASLLVEKLQRAMSKMLGIRRGPVHLSIPTDVQNSEFSSEPGRQSQDDYRFVDIQKLDSLWTKILPRKDNPQGAQKILILAGAGVESSEASSELRAVAEKYHIPVATTLRGKGVFPEDHPLSLGVFGYAGTRHAIETILSGEVDVLMIFGSGLNQRIRYFGIRKIVHVKS